MGLNVKVSHIHVVTPQFTKLIQDLVPVLGSGNQVPITTSYLERMLGEPTTYALAARIGDDYAGAAVLTVHSVLTNVRAELMNVAVLPHYQGQRVATALVEEAIKLAKRLGVNTVQLLTGEGNKHARQRFAHLGFHENPDGMVLYQYFIT